jgi:hypothetical protein
MKLGEKRRAYMNEEKKRKKKKGVRVKRGVYMEIHHVIHMISPTDTPAKKK